MPSKSMVVYVYEVIEEHQDKDCPKSLDGIIAMTLPPEQKEHLVNDKVRRLDSGEFHRAFLLNFITFQYGGDGRVRLGQPVEPPNMERDESFAPETAMLYCPDCQLLIAQDSRGGMSRSAIQKYFVTIAGRGCSYSLIPRADPDIAARLRSNQRIDALTMRISLGEITEWDREVGLSPLKAFGQDLGRGTIEVTIKAEKVGRRRSLNTGAVQSLVQRIMRRDPNQQSPEILEISGKQDDDQRFLPIDLLQHRKRHEFQLTMDPTTRNIPVRERYQALQSIHDDLHKR